MWTVSFHRAEGESTGHVWWEIQTFQRYQIHDKGWQVPGPDIKTIALWLLDQTTLRRWGDVMEEGELVHSLCICISRFTYTNWRRLVAVENGQFLCWVKSIRCVMDRIEPWLNHLQLEPNVIKHFCHCPGWSQAKFSWFQYIYHSLTITCTADF